MSEDKIDALLLGICLGSDQPVVHEAVIRTAVIGVVYQHDVLRLRDQAYLHASNRNAECAVEVATAYLIKLALDGTTPAEYLARTLIFIDGMSEVVEAGLRKVGHVLGWHSETAAVEHLIKTDAEQQAVALALYCLLYYPDNYAAMVQSTAGRTCAQAACIAGAVLGASKGMAAIPAAWLSRCDKQREQREFARQLIAQYERNM